MKKTLKFILKKTLSFFNFTVRKKIGPKRFKIPILGNLGTQNLRVSEKWMTQLLETIIQIDKAKFVDIGVNTGQTLLKLRSISEDMPYIGFEPNASCVHYTNKLIRVNNLKNIILLPVGVSSKTELGVLSFYHDNDGDSSASMIDNFRENTVIRQGYISLFSIDDLKNKVDFSNMSILKIDVEGAELEVIESFEKEISSSNPFIVMEVLPVYDKSKNPDRFERQVKIQSILKELKYTTFRIIKNKDQLVGYDKIDDIGIHSDLEACDYVFIPELKLERFNAITNMSE